MDHSSIAPSPACLLSPAPAMLGAKPRVWRRRWFVRGGSRGRVCAVVACIIFQIVILPPPYWNAPLHVMCFIGLLHFVLPFSSWEPDTHRKALFPPRSLDRGGVGW
jgi:hypothetical protein